MLKQLNSYSRQHPLHKALKDLGRLYKTEEGMLTRVEHGNKFSSVVTLGSNQAFGWQTQCEGEIAIGC